MKPLKRLPRIENIFFTALTFAKGEETTSIINELQKKYTENGYTFTYRSHKTSNDYGLNTEAVITVTITWDFHSANNLLEEKTEGKWIEPTKGNLPSTNDKLVVILKNGMQGYGRYFSCTQDWFVSGHAYKGHNIKAFYIIPDYDGGDWEEEELTRDTEERLEDV